MFWLHLITIGLGLVIVAVLAGCVLTLVLAFLEDGNIP